MIVLGTANFGNLYGSQETKTIVDDRLATKILEFSEKNKLITHIDTAPDYGSSEKLIGNKQVTGLEINSKIHFDDITNNEIQKHFEVKIQRTLENLKINKLNTLIFHRVTDLSRGTARAKVINDLCLEYQGKYFDNIGLSIYTPDDLNNVDLDQINLIQLPYNVLDNRWDCSNTLKNLKSSGVKLQARSIMMRGMLTGKIPSHAPMELVSEIEKFENFHKENGLSAIEACVHHVVSSRLFEQILIGVDNLEQVKVLVSAFERICSVNSPRFKSKLKSSFLDLRNFS